MPLTRNTEQAALYLEGEERDGVIEQRLGGDWPAGKVGKAVCAEGDILFDLNDAYPVLGSLRLNRDDVPRTSLVNTNV